MKERKISATYIYTLAGKILKNGIVVLEEQGTILDVIDTNGELSEIEGLEYYSGILCPGFVNAHCHLELSHLKDKIAPKQGLAAFIKQIFFQRKQNEALQDEAIKKADRNMYLNGIVAVGDISNGTTSLETKELSNIYYHTFIECFGFSKERAQRAMEYAGFVSYLCDAGKLSWSITAHASYSVSDALWELILAKTLEKNSTLSVHHQESKEEDKMFAHQDGELIAHYRDNLKIDVSSWHPTALTSTEAILQKIPSSVPLLLVHNTYLTEEHLTMLKSMRQTNNTFWAACPNSNLYIEGCLPEYKKLKDSKLNVCIGTDSLASNHQLSILEEMKTIAENYANISLEELLTWGCKNGARALSIDDWAGTIEKGKKPGLNLITGIDLKTLQLSKNAKLKKLS